MGIATSSSIIFSSLSVVRPNRVDGETAEQQRPAKVGIGAKSLDRDLGDVHAWPHSHYLMRQCDGVGGWVGAAKIQAVQVQVRVRNVLVQNQ